MAELDFGQLRGFGKLGLEEGVAEPESAVEIFSNLISSTIGLITIIGAIWFVYVFMTGAVGIILSHGDKQAYESARTKILNGIIGLTAIVSGIFFVKLIGAIIGIDVLNLPGMFEQITGVK